MHVFYPYALYIYVEPASECAPTDVVRGPGLMNCCMSKDF